MIAKMDMIFVNGIERRVDEKRVFELQMNIVVAQLSILIKALNVRLENFISLENFC